MILIGGFTAHSHIALQGCDLPHVVRVVQFMVPVSVPIWAQRAGRAGRTPTTLSEAILLVQPTVFQEMVDKSNDAKEDDPPKYRKDIEAGIRRWIETTGCRRDVFDEYFGSGPARKGMSL